MRMIRAVVACAFALLAARAAATPGAAALRPEELKKLSLEELSNVDVSLAFRAPHKLQDTPAAAFLITREDIRRSGATSVPEALRLVPGLIVSRIGSNLWAINARFPTSRFANKFLVLVDGRIAYTPLFGGTFWAVQETLLEDVERMEVIRGTGAALWGSNGITGVIHVITKSAADTHGDLASVTAGNLEHLLAGVRRGGKLDNGGSWRVFARAVERASFDLTGGASADDAWNLEQGGFRADWTRGRDAFTAVGGAHDVDASRRLLRATAAPPFNPVIPQNDDADGAHVLVRGKRTISPREDWTLQAYVDGTAQREVALREERLTGDIDLVHRHEDRSGSERVSGATLRLSSDRAVADPGFIEYVPDRRQIATFALFVQQRWAVLGGRGTVVTGARAEQNAFTGVELQPTLRGTWRLNSGQMVWAAASRSVRVPSRTADDVRVNFRTLPPGVAFAGAPATIVRLFGNRDVDSEVLEALEAGWRAELSERASLDLALFASRHDGLIMFAGPAPAFLELSPTGPLSAAVGSPSRVPHLVSPRVAVNGSDADIAGLELASTLRPNDRWTLHLAYSFLDMEFTTLGARDIGPPGQAPRNQLSLRSQHDLSSRWQLDLFAQYQGSLRTAGVPSHVRADVRLGWRDRDRLEIDLVAQNLFDPGHAEFGREFFLDPVNNTEIGRSVYGKIIARF